MATKTISVDMQAYTLLAKARLSQKESFSQVIKRAKWARQSKSCGALLASLADMPKASEAVIRRLEEAQASDAPPESAWS